MQVAVTGLVKAYGGERALDEVSFTVPTGSVVGLLGPNGAGKSTVLGILCGLVRPDAGRAVVAGHDVAREPRQVHRAVGVVFQDSVLYETLTGRENLDLHARLFGLPRRERGARTEAVLGLVGLTGRAGDRVATYSGGMRRRLALARALLHDPPVLLLDEPTLGIDVQARAAVWEHVLAARDAGRTVLVTTNYMDEADALADRLVVLDRGRVLADDTPAALREAAGTPAAGLADVFLALTGRGLRD